MSTIPAASAASSSFAAAAQAAASHGHGKPALFLIEGNIGAGKTTLLRRLARDLPGCVPVAEPVDDWMALRPPGEERSLFELYFSDKSKYGLAFQLTALLTRMRHLRSVLEGPSLPAGALVVSERSFLSDRHIFARLMREQGHLTGLEHQVYEMWHSFVVEVLQPRVAGVLYLDTPPDVCASRIVKRDRQGEVGRVSDRDLLDLHAAHEALVAASPLPAYRLDGRGTADQVAACMPDLEAWMLATQGRLVHGRRYLLRIDAPAAEPQQTQDVTRHAFFWDHPVTYLGPDGEHEGPGVSHRFASELRLRDRLQAEPETAPGALGCLARVCANYHKDDGRWHLHVRSDRFAFAPADNRADGRFYECAEHQPAIPQAPPAEGVSSVGAEGVC